MEGDERYSCRPLCDNGFCGRVAQRSAEKSISGTADLRGRMDGNAAGQKSAFPSFDRFAEVFDYRALQL